MENWQNVRHELRDVSHLDETEGLKPEVLRQWFIIAATSLDNNLRVKVEEALQKLSRRHETVVLVSQLIRTDNDMNVQVFGATYLANNVDSFVDILLESDNMEESLATLKDILGYGLSTNDMPSNIRAILLNGVLSNVYRNISQLHQSFSVKRSRSDHITKFNHRIMSFVYQAIQESEDEKLFECAAELIKNFWTLNGVELDTMWPIVEMLFASGKVNYNTVVHLTTGIRLFLPKQHPKLTSQFTTYLIAFSREKLMPVMKRSTHEALTDDKIIDNSEPMECNAEICDFYGFLLSNLANVAFSRRSEGESYPQLDFIVENIFNHMVKLSNLEGKPGSVDQFSEAAGMFYNRMYEALTNVIYNVGPERRKKLGAALEPALSPTFVKSRVGPADIYDDELEAIERYREYMEDLVLIMDMLSDHNIISVMFDELANVSNDIGADASVRISRITVIYFYLTSLESIPTDKLLPQANVLSDTLILIGSLDVSEDEKGYCLCYFLAFISSLIEKDVNYAPVVAEFFEFLHPHIRSFLRYPKAQNSALKLIFTYSKHCQVKEFAVKDLCEDMVHYASTNRDPAIQKMVMASLLNFLCVEPAEQESKADQIAIFILEFIESRCERCVQIMQEVTVATLGAFRDQSQIIGFLGQNANAKAKEVATPLVTILCDYLIKLFQLNVPEPDLVVFSNPVGAMVDIHSVRKLAHYQADYAFRYPDVYMRVYKAALDLGQEFVVFELIPHISDLVALVFDTTLEQPTVVNAEVSALELFWFLLKKKYALFEKYVESRSSESQLKNFLRAQIGLSLKTFLYSYSDEAIGKGLRVLQLYVALPENVKALMPEGYCAMIKPIFNLVFSTFFSCGQTSIAQLLVFLAEKAPDNFRNTINSQEQLQHIDERKLLLGKPSKSLFLKYFLKWNANFLKGLPVNS
ncbi:unnamed protein product [Bursaphelenchus okinawaensis]|uniref:Uncharacterized protein n=1 Tax=Bursaphelenchus okinawaensis TaxID=465554 RepID=A0A811KR18_9BILA|nr:unnamed protein product [Bursaphelenchus okinawaensis]CAG9108405.1 unnamed protein product [Bursaphelenchus okinawaensis]